MKTSTKIVLIAILYMGMWSFTYGYRYNYPPANEREHQTIVRAFSCATFWPLYWLAETGTYLTKTD